MKTKLPPEILELVFRNIRSECDAEQFFRAVFTNGEDSDYNKNKFLRFCERKRWDNQGIAHILPLPYNEMYYDEVRRIAAIEYNFEKVDTDHLPRKLIRLFDGVKLQWDNLRRTMDVIRRYAHTERENPWIWKLEAKERYRKAAQFLLALDNLLGMDSELEQFLVEMEGTIRYDEYETYKRMGGEFDRWYMFETESEEEYFEDE